MILKKHINKIATTLIEKASRWKSVNLFFIFDGDPEQVKSLIKSYKKQRDTHIIPYEVTYIELLKILNKCDIEGFRRQCNNYYRTNYYFKYDYNKENPMKIYIGIKKDKLKLW